MRRTWSLSIAAFLGAQAALLPGCFIDGTAFESAGAGAAPGGAGNGGIGGTGGAGNGGSIGDTTTSGDTTSTSGDHGTTSSTSGPGTECESPSDCPPLDSPCQEPRCVNGTCTPQNRPDGESCSGGSVGECYEDPTCQDGACIALPRDDNFLLPDHGDPDCKRPACNGMGGMKLIPFDSDPPDSSFCAVKWCSAGVVQTTPKNEGSACLTDVFVCCDGKCCDVLTCSAVCGD